MRIPRQLFHKLSALVLIPLAMNISFAAGLYAVSNSADADAMTEHKWYEAANDLSDIYQRTVGAGESVVRLVLLRQETGINLEQSMRDQSLIPEDLKRIKELVGSLNLSKDSASVLKSISAIEKNTSASLSVIDEILSDMQTGNRLGATTKLKFLKDTGLELSAQLKELQQDFADRANDALEKQQAERSRFLKIFVAAIIFNLALAILLLFLIHRNITSRLQVMMDNTTRLAAGKPLLPVVGGGDEIAHLSNVFQDTAQALEAARQKREEMERLKQEFVVMVSHDLRTPLTSIQVFLNMLSRDMFGDVGDRVKEKATGAEKSASRLIALINDLLDMEKMESGQLALACDDVLLSEIFERSLEAVRAVADKNGIAVDAAGCGAIRVHVDQDRIVQVVVNLLGNAIKFSPGNSHVLLDVEDAEAAVTIKVTDRGRGVPKTMQTEIFERFKQVNNKDRVERSGTGLGLAICKAIVEQHGGAIGVLSDEGVGSTFWFTLPKVQASGEAVQNVLKNADAQMPH